MANNNEVRILFAAILDDIKFTKKQQLELTNYAIASLIAIFYFFDIITKEGGIKCWVNITLGSLSAVIVGGGIYVLYRLEKDLKNSRDRKKRAIELLPPKIVNYILYGSKSVVKKKDKRKPLSVVWVYKTVLIIGELLVLYFVVFRPLFRW